MTTTISEIISRKNFEAIKWDAQMLAEADAEDTRNEDGYELAHQTRQLAGRAYRLGETVGRMNALVEKLPNMNVLAIDISAMTADDAFAWVSKRHDENEAEWDREPNGKNDLYYQDVSDTLAEIKRLLTIIVK